MVAHYREAHTFGFDSRWFGISIYKALVSIIQRCADRTNGLCRSGQLEVNVSGAHITTAGCSFLVSHLRSFFFLDEANFAASWVMETIVRRGNS